MLQFIFRQRIHGIHVEWAQEALNLFSRSIAANHYFIAKFIHEKS